MVTVWLFIASMVVICFVGFTIGEVYGRTKERSEILTYYQHRPMSLLEEAVNYLYLTVKRK